MPTMSTNAPPERGQTQNTRPTIGFLTHSIIDEYGVMMWHGVMDAGKACDVNVIGFISNEYPTPSGGSPEHARTIYDLVRLTHIDGLIISGGPLSSFVRTEAIATLLHKYRPLPMVMIGMADFPVPHVLINNITGMEQLIRHFIDVHQYRRLAFIQGPPANNDAKERYDTYCRLLDEYRIPFDAQLVTPGDFSRQSGKEAIRLLLRERRAAFDAVIAVNDNSALGALEELQGQGLAVPQQAAVGGFDNIGEVKSATPPITTVRQPIRTLGFQAVRMVVGLLAHQPIEPQIVFDSELVIRQSCGCQAHAELPLSTPIVVASDVSLEALLAEQRDAIITDMSGTAIESEHCRQWAALLFDSFVGDILRVSDAPPDSSQGQFLPVLADMPNSMLMAGENVTECQDALFVLWNRVCQYIWQRPEVWFRANRVWQQGLMQFGDLSQRLGHYQALQANYHDEYMRHLQSGLFTSFKLSVLMNVLADGLPRLGIPRCYLALYEDHEDLFRAVRVPLAYNEHERIALAPEELRFASVAQMLRTLLPAKKQYSMVLIPLYFFTHPSEQQLGFAVFDAALRDRNTYDMLRVAISNSLRVLQLLTEIQGHRHHLEDLVTTRTAELVEERHLLRTLIDHLPDAVYVKDRDSRFLLANQAVAVHLGLARPDEVIGKTDFDLHDKDFARRYHEDEQRILSTGRPMINHEEVIVNRTSGETRWLLTTKVPFHDSHARISGIVGVNRDITRLKHTQEQLLQLEKAVETMSLGVTITDANGRILYTNPADARMHGYDVEELLGQDARRFAPPENQHPATLENMQTWTGMRRESVNIRKDGSRFPVWLMSEVVRNPQGNPIAIVTSCEDITARKQAEEELKRHRDHLEELVTERTAELTDAHAQLLSAHGELRVKNRQLQESNASKDTFFSIISHDLRSPFNLLLNFSELLEENVGTYSRAEIRTKARKLRVTAEHLYALLENLLTWSRIQRGAMEYRPETLAIDTVIDDQLAFFELKAEHKGLTLSAEVSPDLFAYADEHMLEVVLRNLLSNAIKFTPPKGAITLKAHAAADQRIEVAVSDTGRGIPTEDLGKLFRIDVKYSNPGTAGEQGTGLGLNLCKELVEKNGGSIAVESDVEQGTTFRFTLPRAENPA